MAFSFPNLNGFQIFFFDWRKSAHCFQHSARWDNVQIRYERREPTDESMETTKLSSSYAESKRESHAHARRWINYQIFKALNELVVLRIANFWPFTVSGLVQKRIQYYESKK